ncbi:unnamed protein product [Adineta steineri]|uniref:TIR domain-containing protein n=2 Tax=Adineta steineri TaxID=433720 RepID=A0A815B5C1_9BILA|nr:unnamed protein product [Adineta steineri]CAF1265841.1 unnamed protein product [Adineta steineri]
MSDLITERCTTLETWKQNSEYYKQDDDILNDLHTELLRLKSSNIVIFRQELNKVVTLLCTNVIYLNETILTFLRDYFIELFQQWRELTYFNDSNDSNIFENLSIIFTNLCYSNQLEKTSLIEEFCECLNTIARMGQPMFTNSHIPVINRLLNSYLNIESHNKSQLIENSSFRVVIIKCLCVPYTVEIFNQLKRSAKSEERSLPETFVFSVLLYYVSFLSTNQLEQNAPDLRKHLLPSIYDLLNDYAVSLTDWSNSAVNILTDVTTTFLYRVDMTMPHDEDFEVQVSIINIAIQIVLGQCRSAKLHKNCIQYVYAGTLSDNTLDYLKSQKLTQTMLKLCTMYKGEAEIQFNIYRILAAIMTEDDIKRLDDPGAIAKVFLDHLREVMNWVGWEARLKNLLSSLKILLQHDQIRDEVYKQDGIPLFIECATKTKFEALIQQRALENLLIMSFDKNVCKNLKENTTFIEYITTVSKNPTQSDLQRAAESLLWILTKDETSEVSQTNQSSETTYDIMISYSHKDKDLCFQLYDRLQKDNFRVWLDREQMHGTPLEAMSNAIENSEFVFICMSDGYKQSGYCKMEAYYALERQRCIIPLVMKSQYRPDGWLGIVVTGRMRIDFPKYGFDDAYDKLMIEIDRNRKEKKIDMNQNSARHHEMPSVSKPLHNTQIVEDKKVLKATYQAKSDHRLPSNIEQWTVDDVQQFFIKQQLENFLPICSQMKGTRLLALYKMCMTNSPTMLQSLNNELTTMEKHGERNVIGIAEYLQFLEDIKPFVPISNEKSDVTVPRSSLCTLL